MFFSATKRGPLGSLRDSSAAGRPPLRLWLGLGTATLLLAAWVVWRFGWAAPFFAMLPQWLVESINLLTFSAVTTLALLWAIVLAQRGRDAGHRIRVAHLAELQALSPAQFEQFSAELFRARGYHVRVRGRSGDLGVDLEIVNESGKRAIAQCKRYRSTVGPDVVRELYGTMIHERVAHAFLITTADISDHARDWAAGKPMTLIDGPTLLELANETQLRAN